MNNFNLDLMTFMDKVELTIAVFLKMGLMFLGCAIVGIIIYIALFLYVNKGKLNKIL